MDEARGLVLPQASRLFGQIPPGVGGPSVTAVRMDWTALLRNRLEHLLDPILDAKTFDELFQADGQMGRAVVTMLLAPGQTGEGSRSVSERLRGLLATFLVLAAYSVFFYQMTLNLAADWAVRPDADMDTLQSDLDGLPDDQVEQVATGRPVPEDRSMWPVTGGLLTEAVLEMRIESLRWWKAYQLSGRLAAQAPGSGASAPGAEVHRQLGWAIGFGLLSFLTLVSSGWPALNPKDGLSHQLPASGNS